MFDIGMAEMMIVGGAAILLLGELDARSHLYYLLLLRTWYTISRLHTQQAAECADCYRLDNE